MSAPKFSIVPAEVPTSGVAGIYEAIVKEFLSTDLKSARIEVQSKKASTISVGLSKAIRDGKHTHLKALTRQDGAYLVRV